MAICLISIQTILCELSSRPGQGFWVYGILGVFNQGIQYLFAEIRVLSIFFPECLVVVMLVFFSFLNCLILSACVAFKKIMKDLQFLRQ